MIRTEGSGRVRVITLDRPGARNALTREGIADLQAAIRDTEAPVVYLRGAGPAFCAGADLDTVRALEAGSATEFAQAGQALMNTIEGADSVVVAGVDGPARGGGVELVLAADVRIATPDATFAEPGVSLGIFGAWGGTRRLPAAVGETQALDLSLSGRTIDANEARAIGLVSRIVENPRDVAEEIATNDPAALRTLKNLLRERSGHEEQEAREAAAFADLLADGIGDTE